MENAIKLLAAKKGWTLDTANSKISDAVKINYYVDSQTTVENLLGRICTYGDHIWRVQGNTLTVYDMLQDSNIQVVHLSDIIMDGYSMSFPEIIKGWKAKWITKGYDATLNDLKITENEETKKSGLDSGVYQDVEVFDYQKTNIQAVLERKNTLYAYPKVQLQLVGIHNYKPCTRLDLDFKDSWCKFDHIRVFTVDWDFANYTTTVRGIAW